MWNAFCFSYPPHTHRPSHLIHTLHPHTPFDVLQFVSSARPTEGVLLGALLLVTAAGMMPLLLKCYPSNQVRARKLQKLLII